MEACEELTIWYWLGAALITGVNNSATVAMCPNLLSQLRPCTVFFA